MMKRIVVENFRCFHERQEAVMAPLTLLVGENSTGKTSFLALTRAIREVAFREVVPNFKQAPYDLGTFVEIAHNRGGSDGQSSSFEAGFEMAPKNAEKTSENFHFQVMFQRQRNGTAPIPVKRRLSQGAMWVEEQRNQRRFRVGVRKGKIVQEEKLFPRAYALPGVDEPGIDGIFPLHMCVNFISAGGSSVTDEERDRLFSFMINFREMAFEGLYAGSPVRSKPRRTYDPSPEIHDPEGAYIPMYLGRVSLRDKDEWKKLKQDIEQFGRDSELFSDISVKTWGTKASSPFKLQIRKLGESGKKAMGPKHNLIDVGYGVSQVLPVITELLRPNSPKTFLLQQPEVHLHPRAQAALGSLFCRLAGTGRQLVVETHSDYLLDRVRMDIRDGKSELKPEDVSILYFERKDLDVEIHSLRLDKEGQIVEAPPSYRKFFMDEIHNRLKI
ncbi:MAG: AAA family ATPase [Deltaproteobacteria bacterium]|nr:AAA family ATPase [Deltaproteobacteria bacterium]MDD9872992.1 AAA family ATPase [Deltaproteobacteria bacterium]